MSDNGIITMKNENEKYYGFWKGNKWYQFRNGKLIYIIEY